MSPALLLFDPVHSRGLAPGVVVGLVVGDSDSRVNFVGCCGHFRHFV